MEVVAGVHKVDGTIGSNVYLLVDDRSLALVDTGLQGNAGKIGRYIEGLGRKVSDLRWIILTHSHPDHTGSIRALRMHSDLKVLVHRDDVRWDQDGRPRIHYVSQPLALEWDVPFFQKIFADEVVEEGYTLPILGGLSVLHTPGHTAGSINLYLPQLKVMFTGDTLISNGKLFTRPISFPGTNGKLYRRSVERLATLNFDVACVGHGRPLVGGATKMLKEMIRHYFWAGTGWNLLRRLFPSLYIGRSKG